MFSHSVANLDVCKSAQESKHKLAHNNLNKLQYIMHLYNF